MTIRVGILGLALAWSSSAFAAELNVAVAANFAPVMERLAKVFARQSGIRLIQSSGSSGKLFAQIRNGAPFQVFLSADAEHPRKLVELGLARKDSIQTYAIGRLVLWSAKPGFVDSEGEVLRRGKFRYLAISNPDLAPYGVAAREVLEKLGLWATLQPRIVMGENAAQTLQFIVSGNAELGFVAESQVPRTAGALWKVPETLYRPLRQDAVILKESGDARALMRFLESPAARAMIEESGYAVPAKEAR